MTQQPFLVGTCTAKSVSWGFRYETNACLFQRTGMIRKVCSVTISYLLQGVHELKVHYYMSLQKHFLSIYICVSVFVPEFILHGCVM